MKILVLLRGWRSSPEGALHPALLGPAERQALDVACALAEDAKGATVTTLAVGDDREEEALREALRLGAHQAVRLWDPLLSEVDALGVVKALAAAANYLEFDVVLAGDRSPDLALGYHGPAVAESLDIPHLAAAVSLLFKDDQSGLMAQRINQGRRYTHSLGLPCLVTLYAEVTAAPSAHASTARPASAPDLEAKTTPPIRLLSLADVELNETVLMPRMSLKRPMFPSKIGPLQTQWVDSPEALLKRLQDLALVD